MTTPPIELLRLGDWSTRGPHGLEGEDPAVVEAALNWIESCHTPDDATLRFLWRQHRALLRAKSGMDDATDAARAKLAEWARAEGDTLAQPARLSEAYSKGYQAGGRRMLDACAGMLQAIRDAGAVDGTKDTQ